MLVLAFHRKWDLMSVDKCASVQTRRTSIKDVDPVKSHLDQDLPACCCAVTVQVTVCIKHKKKGADCKQQYLKTKFETCCFTQAVNDTYKEKYLN